MAEVNNHTDLDKELQKLASENWQAFVELVGNDAIVAAKVCMLRSRGKSLKMIATKLNKSKTTVFRRAHTQCKPCVVSVSK